MGKTVLELPPPDGKVLELESPEGKKARSPEVISAALAKKAAAVEGPEDLEQAVFDGLVLG